MSRFVAALLALGFSYAPLAAQAPPSTAYVADTDAPGRFPLAADGRVATLVVSSNEYAGVRRAAADLRADLARVTSAEPVLAVDSVPRGVPLVIVGTIGHSALVDALVRQRKLDVAGITGKWESWVTQVVPRPFPGVDRALVIAGSDKRGTTYGTYELSSEIGVSPWSWWADVPVRKQTSLYVLATRRTQGEPAVKYRGIFINDEAPAFSGWAREKFGGVNHLVYAKVFELILRLKGNYLWPAMWGNAFADDDSLNAALADEYGIVMGTSHHEPLTRAQQEWRRYGKGPWNYEENDSTLRAFWRAGIERMGARENIVTVGMRGDGDMPMTEGSNIALLERIVADQRTIIAEVTKQPPSATPQLWALYKEVQDYYDKGMRVPEDITLLFADDNWGNIRRLLRAEDRNRPGGFGVYYHFDYVGGPRNYKWLNTNPLARVWEQLHLAHATGADRIWIVNVGDLKPMELPISFFLDYAWNPDAWPAERLSDYTRQWAERQFGAAYAREIANVLTRYGKYAGRRKPELLGPETFSLTNYREAETVVADYTSLARDAQRIGNALPAEYRDAYYELVLHPVLAQANLNDLYVTVAKNRLYAQQGRASTNDLADRARRLFARDAEISRYYNDTLAGGKWSHMMDQTHIGYSYWQEPSRNVMPRVDVIQVPLPAELGVAWEGQAVDGLPGSGGVALAGDGPSRRDPPALPVMDPYARQSRWIDVFNRGQTPFAYSVQTGEPWVIVTPSSGRVTQERRLEVRVDWANAPTGMHRVPLTITGPNDRRVVILALISNPPSPRPEAIVGHAETSGYVSIEAEHYTQAVAHAPLRWQRVPDLGRTLSGMTPVPVMASSQTPGGASPRLEYRIVTFDSGSVQVRAYLSPTLNFSGRKEGLRYAVSFDDEVPQIVNITADSSQRTWAQNVSDNVSTMTTRHELARPGVHTLKFWMVDPGVVLQKLLVDFGGVRPSYLGPPESFYRAESVKQQPASKPRFDWFEYRGSDSAYLGVKLKPDEYLNPILAGFYPDPSVVRVGDDYYLVTSSFAYFPGVPIFRSKNLVDWTQIGSVLDRPSQLDLDSAGISRGIFAPVIRYHAGTFYMITTLIDRGGNFIVTATNPAGPWSDPVWLPEIDGIDPSIFFDDDGKAYIVNNGPPVGQPLYEGHRAIWMQEFDARTMKLVGAREVIVNGGVDLSKKPIWIEAPHILKVDGKYYLICAEGGTAEQHSEVVFRSDDVRGPYVPFAGNPILTQRHLDLGRPLPVTTAGHADFVRTPGGEWWSVFLGVRPYDARKNLYNNGRETYLLPVRWVDGWPRILDGEATVPYVQKRPTMPVVSMLQRGAPPAPRIPTSGNFVVRDDFDGPALAPYWNLIRTPRSQWYDLTSTRGRLTIEPRPEDLGGKGQPSFIGRRQQHLFASATTSMQYTPAKPGDKAGLAAFHNEDHYYLLSVTRSGTRTEVQLERRSAPNTQSELIASAPLTSTRAPIQLQIRAKGGRYDFLYATAPGKWKLLAGDLDGTVLSTKVAGGFVGTMFGLYAYSAP